MGFDSCQIACWNNSCYTDEMAEKINSACKEYGVNVSTFWAGWSGPGAWNFYEGQLTLGLVPAEYRDVRRRELIEASHFVKNSVLKILQHIWDLFLKIPIQSSNESETYYFMWRCFLP